MGAAARENRVTVSLQIKSRVTIGPIDDTYRYTPQRMKKGSQRDTGAPAFPAPLFTGAKRWEPPFIPGWTNRHTKCGVCVP